jgi:mercuric ion transport protein
MTSDLAVRSPVADRPARSTGAVLLTLGGLAAAFGVASCCALPFLLATAGLGTAWLYGIAVLAAPHRGFLLGAAAICLAGGAVLLWRQGTATAACAPGGVCSHPAVRSMTLVCLLAGLVLLCLGYTYV